MKTIFISISRGVLIRNILRTDVLKFLLEKEDIRIIILSCNLIHDYFKKEFEHPRIFLEYAPSKKFSKWRKFFVILFDGLVYTVSERRNLKYGNGEKEPPKKYVYYARHAAFSVLSKFKFLKYIARWIENNIFIDTEYDNLFLKYKPDLVFCSSIYSILDTVLVKAAKRFDIPSVCMPKSWDTIGRLFFRAIADKIILNNESMKEWIVKEQLVRPENIYVSGLPQFDIYAQKEKYLSKEEFCRRTGLDKDEPIILYAGEDQLICHGDLYVEELIQKYNILDKYNLIVRPHFTSVSKKKYERFKGLKNLYVDDQNVRVTNMFGDGWDVTRENMDWLAEVIHVSDAVISFMSSFVLDAIVYDKPVINPFYDVKTTERNIPILETYRFIHYDMVLAQNGVAIAKSPEELLEWIEKYLKDPAIHQDGRQKILEKFCYKKDGKSAERIAQIALKMLCYKND